VNGAFTPTSVVAGLTRRRGRLDSDDTTPSGLRLDYVQPSSDLDVRAGGVIRGARDMAGAMDAGEAFVASDHYPVWVDIALEQPVEGR
jgi:endonuclease/exonuclease/phosphatase family metal-dependent hydrolase